MTTSKKIECPACGASGHFKHDGSEYECDYCHTSFKVGENKANDFLNAINRARTQPRSELVIHSQSKKSSFIIVSFVFLVIISIGISVFFSIKNSGKNVFSHWQSPSIKRYIAFTGSKGPIVWEILEQSSSGLDSSKHTLRIIDPIKNKLLVEKTFGEITTWKENFNYDKKLNDDFLLINDTLYNGSEDGGLQVFDIYSGQKLLDNKYFENKYPQLKDGIIKVESRLSNNEFIISTKTGDEFYFYPIQRFITTKEELKNIHETDTTTECKFYFSEGKKCNLYTATIKKTHHDNGYLDERYIKGYSENDRFYKDHFKNLNKVNDKIYPHAQRLITKKDFIVCVYTADFSKNPAPIVEKIDNHGKVIWRNQDTALKMFTKNFSSNNLYLNFSTSDKDIVFYNSGALYHSLGINLNTGKTIFVHVQGNNLN